jgi:glycosyltransferase involved in cell wall biosynthesis
MMTDKSLPLVSVIMNCYNCKKYLREAIDSVYAQTYPHWEIIFWDNASTDGSEEIAHSFDERLRYFRGSELIPLGAARNLALKKAQGEFIAFLDCDDLWMPQKLGKQIPLFNDPQVGLVFSDTIYFNDSGKNDRLYAFRSYKTGACFAALLSDYFLAMPSVVIRRAALDREPAWFDPNFVASNDSEFLIRLAYHWKLAMVNEPLAKWRIHPGSLTWQKFSAIADEIVEMVAKYKRIFPNFAQRYAREIRILESSGAVIRAKDAIARDNLLVARKYLAPHVFANIKALILYLITYLPKAYALSLINKFSMMKLNPD